MSSDVEFNSEQNGVIVKLKCEKNLGCFQLEKNYDPNISEKGFFVVFTYFHLNLFLSNICCKILEHRIKDAEFYGDFYSIVEILAESLFKKFSSSFSFFTVAVE